MEIVQRTVYINFIQFTTYFGSYIQVERFKKTTNRIPNLMHIVVIFATNYFSSQFFKTHDQKTLKFCYQKLQFGGYTEADFQIKLNRKKNVPITMCLSWKMQEINY